MLLNSHISAYARCLARKVCGLVRFTWGTSRGEDPLGARDCILNTKVARRACAGRAPGKHSPSDKTQIKFKQDSDNTHLKVRPVLQFPTSDWVESTLYTS